jgi:hypothetical protein
LRHHLDFVRTDVTGQPPYELDVKKRPASLPVFLDSRRHRS